MLNLKIAVRQLWRSPGFVATVLLMLGLAIGANTAIFSLFNALLLKQLPYPHPERIGTIYLHMTGITGPGEPDHRKRIDGQQWELLRDQVPSLLSAVYLPSNMESTFQAGSNVQYVHAARVSAHYFDVLAIRPQLGRNFLEEEDRPHGPKAVIISYSLWQSLFHGDPHVLGQSILLKGEPQTVVGALAKDAITPLSADTYTVLQPSREGEGHAGNFYVITRLHDGATWQQADAELDRAWANSMWAERFARFNPGAQYLYYSVALQKSETDSLRPQLAALLLAAGLILLIACANLAGLTLVRMLRRTREIATRLALGASSWQVQKQIWLENLLLALAGGIVGIVIGFAALRGMRLLLPEHFLPIAKVPLDSAVLGFTFALSLLTSVLFGLWPAVAMRKVDLRSAMATRSVIGGGGVWLRQALIAGQVALTIVLLAAAGLLIRNLLHLENLPPGFNPNGVIAAKASLDNVRYYDPAVFRKLLDQSVANLRQIPGVENAAYGLGLPYERSVFSSATISDGKQAGDSISANIIYVTPGYFDTLQIPLLEGRQFRDSDGPDAQPVMIVNQTLARSLFHGGDAVGRYVNKALIVGLVRDTVLSGRLHAGAAPLENEEAMYIPAAQVTSRGELALSHGFFQPSWIVRTAHPVENLNAEMQRRLAAADPNLPFSGFFAMSDLMAEKLSMQRVEVALLLAIASLAVLLSAVGIFGLVANLVAQRTREIGIRMALGSSVQRAMVHVARTGIGASVLGLAIGLVLCFGVLRFMRSVLWGVGVYDGLTLLLATATLSAIALLASTIPARRVARIDPAITLRDE